ncbi:MAG TPA: hypothetical protein VG371_14455 [Solirubrobacteraceae bacterium]|nr:hypothetical protein [Solirubrobacteraceae bacterium]
MSDTVDTPTPAADAAAPAPAAEWKVDAQGRSYTPASGRSGLIFRKGNETVEEALARDAKAPKDKPPKPRAARAKKAPAPTRKDLAELKLQVAEALKAPAVLCAMRGHSWAANHFTREGDTLAGNLVAASEHNPWLRAKLEAMLVGDDFLINVVLSLGIASSLAAYAIPPAIYFLPPSVIDRLTGGHSEQAREMFGVPARPVAAPVIDHPSSNGNGSAPQAAPAGGTEPPAV